MTRGGHESGTSGLVIRDMAAADIDSSARVLFDAFNLRNEELGLLAEWPSLEFTRALVSRFFDHPGYLAFVAADEDDRVLGPCFLEIHDFVGAPGPMAIASEAQGRGVGRRLLQHTWDVSRDIGKQAFHFVQVAANARTYGLYARMGFVPREQLTALVGFVDPSVPDLPGYAVRPMTEADVDACDQLFVAAHGYSRRNDILSSTHQDAPSQPYVTEKAHGRIVAYTTGLFLLGHAVGENEEALRQLYVGASRAMRAAGNMPPPLVHLPARLYPETLLWALDTARVDVLRLETMMTDGVYTLPRQGRYWPGMAY
jgi:GNAT superfamily N-acetyltransferase